MYKDKLVYVGFPILNQYELLPSVLQSLSKGTVVPDKLIIVNNGLNEYQIQKALLLDNYSFETKVLQPEKNIGVAKAWNMIIKESRDERLIMNDDILLEKDTLQVLLDTEGEVVCCEKPSGLNAFACFLIRDSAVEKVGYFDEAISPNYAYYEDNDYKRRMDLLGLSVKRAKCSAEHFMGGSRTMNTLSPSRLQAHHMRFNLATENYIKKWGGLPDEELFTVPYNQKESE